MDKINQFGDWLRSLLPSVTYKYDFQHPTVQAADLNNDAKSGGLTFGSGLLSPTVPVGGFSNNQPNPTPTQPPHGQVLGAQLPPSNQSDGFVFDFSKFPKDENWAPGWQPQQPPQAIGRNIRDLFPQEATKAALIAATENGGYDPTAENLNSDGSLDKGIFQVNNNTFGGLLQRKAQELGQMGINSFQDMADPLKNTEVAKIIFDEGGPGRWFGWQNKGYDLNNGYFSQPSRIQYELKKRGYQ